MRIEMDRTFLRALRRPLDRQRLALLIATAACLALLVARPVDAPRRYFLVWNLFLAWVPWWVSRAFRPGLPGTHAMRMLLLLAWLAFLPNAFYMLTDLVHLRSVEGAQRAYDGAMIGAFALTGFALGFASLHRVQSWVHDRKGERFAWGFACLVLGLCGVGVYVGRFLRWNSWDLVTNPGGILDTVLGAFLSPREHLFAFAFSGAFGLTLLVTYAAWTTLARR